MLNDIRVIEVSHASAAAFAGRLFADAGAEVILVEPVDGHPLRREGPFLNDAPDNETSAAHLHINAGKRSLAVEAPLECEEVVRLAHGADVFITDFPTDLLEPAGLSWRELHQRNPSLLMTQVTPFGQTGPYQHYQGTNLVCLALGGQLKITGDPGRPPLSNFGAQAEYQAGLAAFAGTLANLLLRDETGEGEYLDLSIQDITANNLEGRSLTFNLGVMAERSGLNVSAVYGVYPCADGWVFLSAFAPALWEQFKEAAQIPELEADRFSTQASRLANNDELQAILTSWTLSKTGAELRSLAQKGYPLTVAETPQELLTSDQWANRQFVKRIEHPVAGSVAILGPLWRQQGVHGPKRPAPRLGEANREILGEAFGVRR